MVSHIYSFKTDGSDSERLNGSSSPELINGDKSFLREPRVTF